MLLLASGLAAFLISAALVPVCRAVAIRYHVIANPRSDRWHRRPTPLLGGVAIAATVLMLDLLLIGPGTAPVLLAAVAAMFALGLVDDLVALRPATKLIVQTGCAAVLVLGGFRLGWSGSAAIDTALTLLWIVGLTNAFNLLDNIDGLCAGVSMIAGVGVLITLLSSGSTGAEATHLVVLLGATGGFLLFNLHPASIFMGDSGSLFIGLNLSLLALSANTHGPATTNLVSIVAAPMLIFLVPILDTALVAVTRVLSGRNAVHGGVDHSSHRLVAVGLSERNAVVVLWVLSALGGAVAIALTNRYAEAVSTTAALVLVGVAAACAIRLARVRVYAYEEPRGYQVRFDATADAAAGAAGRVDVD